VGCASVAQVTYEYGCKVVWVFPLVEPYCQCMYNHS
jgi:hypothetical protein